MLKHLTLILATLAFSCSHESTLPKLFPVPNASLIAESGKPIQLHGMKGQVTVYDFIFTHCAGTCPLMTSTMRRITTKIDKEAPVRFVSISVDPQRDTPEALRKYASHVRNDARWIFLTGDGKTITDLSVNGFKLAASGSSPDSILHSSKFAVADKEGVIRAYFDGTGNDAVAQVTGAIRDLLRER